MHVMSMYALFIDSCKTGSVFHLTNVLATTVLHSPIIIIKAAICDQLTTARLDWLRSLNYNMPDNCLAVVLCCYRYSWHPL